LLAEIETQQVRAGLDGGLGVGGVRDAANFYLCFQFFSFGAVFCLICVYRNS
jgi:hypothetical protein